MSDVYHEISKDMRLIRYYDVVCVCRDEVLCGYFSGDAAGDGCNCHPRGFCKILPCVI